MVFCEDYFPCRYINTATFLLALRCEISAVLDYDDGCTATVLASGIIPKSAGFRIGFRALFEKASFELKTEFKGGSPQNTFRFFPYSGHPETVSVHETNPYEKELRYFVDCIRGEADPDLLDARHALDALTLSIATQRSLQKHQTITIAEHDPK